VLTWTVDSVFADVPGAVEVLPEAVSETSLVDLVPLATVSAPVELADDVLEADAKLEVVCAAILATPPADPAVPDVAEAVLSEPSSVADA
jgi:hypothetical protein